MWQGNIPTDRTDGGYNYGTFRGARIQILAPVVRGRKGEYHKLFEEIKKNGFVRVRVDGEMLETSEEIKLDKNKKHHIEIIIDRIIIKPGIESRLADSIELALTHAEGLIIVDIIDGKELMFSQNFACADCNINLEEHSTYVFFLPLWCLSCL